MVEMAPETKQGNTTYKKNFAKKACGSTSILGGVKMAGQDGER